MHEVPRDLCANLKVFELWGPKQLPNLDPILPHAHGLTSLALVELTCVEIFPLLSQNPNVFPQLEWFKMMSLDVYHTDKDIQSLIPFMSSKPNMRRLDLDLPGCERPGLMSLLQCISQMPHLEALGMDLRTLTDEGDLEMAAKHVPHNLIAFHLQTCWENVFLGGDEMTPLVRT